LFVANISACGVSGLPGAQSSTDAVADATGINPTSKNTITVAARRLMVRRLFLVVMTSTRIANIEFR
jgi:hypothetical protein